MPQTKPLLWYYSVMIMNFILLTFIMKIHPSMMPKSWISPFKKNNQKFIPKW